MRFAGTPMLSDGFALDENAGTFGWVWPRASAKKQFQNCCLDFSPRDFPGGVD